MTRRGNKKQRKDADTLDLFSWSACRPWEPWDVNHGHWEQKLKLPWGTWWCVSDVTWSTQSTGCLQDWSAPVLENWTPLELHPFPRTLSLYKHVRRAGWSTRNWFSFHSPWSLWGHYNEYESKATFLFSTLVQAALVTIPCVPSTVPHSLSLCLLLHSGISLKTVLGSSSSRPSVRRGFFNGCAWKMSMGGFLMWLV